jgi:hypothetical protein
MATFDPFAGLDGVRTYQERVMVRGARLTRDNAPAIAKIARKTITTDSEGTIFLVGPGTAVWAMEGDMVVATPGRLRVSNRTATDFRAWYSHPGERISEEDLDDDN